MPSENVPAWAVEKADAIVERFADRLGTWQGYPLRDAIAGAIAAERASGAAGRIPVNAFHVTCPHCAAPFDVTPAAGTTVGVVAGEADHEIAAEVWQLARLTPVRAVDHIARALASAHAAGEEKGREAELRTDCDLRAHYAARLGMDDPKSCWDDIVSAAEEKGRREMREEAARVLEHSAFFESFEREVVAIRTLPTTPPTNPLPATGGEE